MLKLNYNKRDVQGQITKTFSYDKTKVRYIEVPQIYINMV